MCDKMDGPRDYDTRRSQKEKDKYHMILYVDSKIQHNQKHSHRHRKQTCGCQEGWGM